MTGTAAILSLVIGSFGNLGELVSTKNPWRGFHSDEFNLVVVRAERVASADCKKWVDAFAADASGTRVQSESLKRAFETWGPFEGEDLEAVQECDDFPCDVKLAEAEAAEMKKAAEESRLATFLSLVDARVNAYGKTGVRKEYEFPGKLVDPWAYLEKMGFKSQVQVPAKGELWVRKTNLDPKRMKTLHQVLDRRVSKSARGATLWVRDAYTDHYFDGWGEWATIDCGAEQPSTQTLTIVQALYLEVDLLKKTDLFSRLARGKLRSAIEDKGGAYLDAAVDRMKARVAN